jgi:hypothetical protein
MPLGHAGLSCLSVRLSESRSRIRRQTFPAPS